MYLYATQISNNTRFFPRAFDEIRSFSGINLMIALIRKSSYKDNWSSKNQIRDSYISSVMSCDRFSWFLGHLHLNDNSVQPKKGECGYEKLCKIRPVLEVLSFIF